MIKYLREITGGSWSLITGMAITLKYFFKPPVTDIYPFKKKEMFSRYKGPTSFVRDQKTGSHRCIACDLCVKICPSFCIDLVKERGDDRKFHLKKYTVDYSLCSVCSLCIEVCPTDALTHSQEFELASSAQKDFVIDFLEPFNSSTQETGQPTS